MKFTKSILSAVSALTAMTLSVSAEAPASYAASCAACHQPTGLGLAGTFPPLAGSEWVNGNVENLIRIQLRGLTGPIKVKGETYSLMPMAANAHMSDDAIAEVLTYIRSSWGNTGSAVTADMVKALRSEAGKPALTVADLKDPSAKAAATDTAAEPKTAEPKTAEPKTAEPKTAEPKTAEPKGLDLKSGDYKETEKVGSTDTYIHYVYGFAILCIIPMVLAFCGRKK